MVVAEKSERGRRFKRKLRDNHEARKQALESVRPYMGGWQARLGGPVRGTLRTYATREAAEADVNGYYNAIIHRWVMAAAQEREVTSEAS
jgi:hypothetical protein